MEELFKQVHLTITNNTGVDMIFERAWFQLGEIKPGTEWPNVINNGDQVTIICGSPILIEPSCSGYCIYRITSNNTTGNLIISFSNPTVGDNKLGIGNADPKYVWENMSNHDYQPWAESLEIGGGMFNLECQCSGGDVNYAGVTIIPA